MASAIEFSLIFNKTSTHDQMAQALSKRLHRNPKLLRFTISHEGNPQDVIHPEGKLIKRSSYYGCSHQQETVADMIQSSHDENKLNNIFFHELLYLPAGEVRPKATVKVTWTSAHHREEGRYSFLMPMTSTMQNVANKFSTMVKSSKSSSRIITLFATQLGQIQKSFTGQEILNVVRHLEENLCRRIDGRPEGASIVSNQELVGIAETELDHFRLLHQNTVSGQSVLLMQAPSMTLESERVYRNED